jgi:hypothetical protein
VRAENSSANCVDLDNVSHVGWTRTFDAISGAVLFDHATSDPGCTVCFKQ